METVNECPGNPAAHSAASGCGGCGLMPRRKFLGACAAGAAGAAVVASAAGATFLSGCATVWPGAGSPLKPIQPCGPASKRAALVQAAFVRRKGEYGVRWPGQIYDGKAAHQKYAAQLQETANKIGAKLDLRPVPIYNAAEAEARLADAKAANADGLMVVLLDRQDHAWPTAQKAAASGIPTIVFSPLGSSFTTNTAPLAGKPGCVIYSTDDFSHPAYGMKMLQAGARMRSARCVVIRGTEEKDGTLGDLGIALRYVPARTFLDEYQKMPVTNDVLAMADDYMRRARRVAGATREDVINGAKSYAVARAFLEREKADAITMDCLGALGATKVSLPCLAWSRMNDDGIPAACEADLGAVASHIVVQYLFDRPGFQQDPVADTANDAVIGAHCSCATRLNGFDKPCEPFDIIPHHGARDAVPRTLWRVGQRVTMLDVLPGDAKKVRPAEFIVAAGTVMDNIDAPPAGGCVVSVRVKFDGNPDVLTFPGFHQVFFYGDCKKQLRDFCQLFDFKAQLI
ncbi:MAG: hypothetical protein NTX50_02470 [Candidatus Sumerlaeota bacterium]|nr:hypothetical protein [Candidatus Sumerlaeota bacterium]